MAYLPVVPNDRSVKNHWEALKRMKSRRGRVSIAALVSYRRHLLRYYKNFSAEGRRRASGVYRFGDPSVPPVYKIRDALYGY